MEKRILLRPLYSSAIALPLRGRDREGEVFSSRTPHQSQHDQQLGDQVSQAHRQQFDICDDSMPRLLGAMADRLPTSPRMLPKRARSDQSRPANKRPNRWLLPDFISRKPWFASFK